MHKNPYSEEPIGSQPTEVVPRGGMPDLPPKQPLQPVMSHQPHINETDIEVESAEARQEEARTVRYAIGKLNDFLQWFIMVLEVTLAMRFLLKLIGADPGNLFAGFVYALTDIILFPFNGIVQSPSMRLYQAFEWSTLIAMIVYALVFWAIRRFLSILITSPEEPAS